MSPKFSSSLNLPLLNSYEAGFLPLIPSSQGLLLHAHGLHSHDAAVNTSIFVATIAVEVRREMYHIQTITATTHHLFASSLPSLALVSCPGLLAPFMSLS